MSFIKDVIKDFTQSEVVLNAENIRTQARGFLWGGIGLMAFFIIYTLVVYLSDDPTIPLQVMHRSNETTETTLNTALGVVNNSELRILHYHPKSFVDFILFNSIGLFNIVDFAFALYIGILMFRTLKTVNEQNTFQITIGLGYKKFGRACIWMYCLKLVYDIFLHTYFNYRASDNLRLDQSTGLQELNFLYIFFGGIISSFAYFMNKGISLQQDQDLTI